MELDEGSRKFMTITTHKGLYEYQRLPFGVASAPAIWQRAMDQVLQGLPNVQCYLDDIIVSGKTVDDHLQSLNAVLDRLQYHGLRVNRAKCRFLLPSVEYCGHVISADGLQQSPKNLAVQEMPPPANVTQLRSPKEA